MTESAAAIKLGGDVQVYDVDFLQNTEQYRVFTRLV